MTVSETRSLWCSSTLKTALVAVHRHRLLTSQVCRPPLCMSESFTAPILVLQDNFRCHPRGWRRGCCTCYGCTYPLKPGVGVVKKGLSSNRSCLDGLAGGNRGGPSTRRSQHTSTLSLGVWPRVGVARVVRAQSASQVSDPSSEIAANCLRHRWNAILGAADNVRLICSHSDMLTKYLHRIRHRIRHRILYIVCDIVGIHDVVYGLESGREPARTAWEYHSSACNCLE
jgi:hypothetical protein